MDAKGSDASRTSTGKAERSWWRWTHGKSGSISSSSDGVSKPSNSPSSQFAGAGVAANSGSGGGGAAHLHGHGEFVPPSAGTKNNSSIKHSFSCSSVTHSASPSEKMRWQKRAARAASTGPAREDLAASALSFRDTWAPMLASTSSTAAASSESPKFFSSFSPRALSRRGAASGKKKAAITSSRSAISSRPAAARKSSAFGSSDQISHSQIAWSTAPTSKRKVTRKEKKSPRVTGSLPSSRASLHGSRSYRPSLPKFGEDDDTEMYASAFANAQVKASRKSSSPSDWSRSSDLFLSSGDVFFKPITGAAPPASVASTASTSSSTSSSSSHSSFGASPFASSGRSDPVVDCARAVLQDCIRQRHMEYNNARKRAIEGCDTLESKGSGWHYATVSKSSDWSMMSSGSSSSSDEELSQLSSLDRSFICDDKHDRNSCESKMSSEEYLRQAMLQGCALSSSPELECFSPLYEEKGLPVEIRYQLPIALGTANETDKQCTICQIRYGIGDHIVTLPCQHFFHACCVDKWLWNHTSCPLCRMEVSLEAEAETTSAKSHKFNECSETDQNRLRRQLRSTSHTAGFRPVIPVEEEIAELESSITTMNIDEDDCSSDEEEEYLVCPTPQRPCAD